MVWNFWASPRQVHGGTVWNTENLSIASEAEPQYVGRAAGLTLVGGRTCPSIACTGEFAL